jgi:WD40 repeat protein
VLAHDDAVNLIAFSPDGRFMAAATWATAAHVYDVATGKEQVRLPHDGVVNAIAFSPDSRLVATASADKTARVFDAATGRELSRLAHDEQVNAIAFSPDGRLVATGSLDRTARIFDATTGREQARLAQDGEVKAIAFTPDGKILGTAADRAVRLWPVFADFRALVDAAKAKAARCLTLAQRQTYFLPPAPPPWCVERRLWPYHGDAWQAWLAERKAGGDPPLPQR